MRFPFVPLMSEMKQHLQQLFSEACVITITDDLTSGSEHAEPGL